MAPATPAIPGGTEVTTSTLTMSAGTLTVPHQVTKCDQSSETRSLT